MDKRKYFREDMRLAFQPMRVLFFILIGIAAIAVMGYVVTFLWNYTLPALLNVKQISFWQSVALLLLCRILFGSFGRGRYSGGKRRRFGPPPELKEKLMNMSDEERLAFREELRRRCQK